MRTFTVGILAAVYRVDTGKYLTHSWVQDADKTLCKKIRAEHLADTEAENPDLPPTCPICRKRDTRFDK